MGTCLFCFPCTCYLSRHITSLESVCLMNEWMSRNQSIQIWDSVKSLNTPSNCSHERCLQIAFPHRWYQPGQTLSRAWHTEKLLLLPTSHGHRTLAFSLTAIIHKEPEMEVTAAQMCLHPWLGKLVLPFVGGVWDSPHMGHTPLVPAYPHPWCLVHTYLQEQKKCAKDKKSKTRTGKIW